MANMNSQKFLIKKSNMCSETNTLGVQTIIGLGNPGDKYIKTRHNVGFVVLNKLAEQHKLTWKENKKFNSHIIKTNKLLLIKPMTYMNNSGRAVSQILSYYKILQKKFGLLLIKNLDLADTVTIIHDEIDIDLGKYKVSTDSRSAGHRGVQSVINHLKTKNFRRIRIGIKTDSIKNIPTEKYVLMNFNKKEQTQINNIIQNILNEI